MKLIVCPLEKELKLLKTAFAAHEIYFSEKKIGPLVCWQNESLTLAVGGHGKTQFAIQTEFLLQQIKNVEHIICVGAAGSLHPEVCPLDLIFVNEIIEHDYIEKFNTKAKKPYFFCNTQWSQNSLFNFKVHRGKLASGDEDIVDVERAKELQQSTGAIAVAWESAGGARVAKFHNIPYSEVRGITDVACIHAQSDFMKNLEQAMVNVTAFLVSSISLNT